METKILSATTEKANGKVTTCSSECPLQELLLSMNITHHCIEGSYDVKDNTLIQMGGCRYMANILSLEQVECSFPYDSHGEINI